MIDYSKKKYYRCFKSMQRWKIRKLSYYKQQIAWYKYDKLYPSNNITVLKYCITSCRTKNRGY